MSKDYKQNPCIIITQVLGFSNERTFQVIKIDSEGN